MHACTDDDDDGDNVSIQQKHAARICIFLYPDGYEVLNASRGSPCTLTCMVLRSFLTASLIYLHIPNEWKRLPEQMVDY